MKAAAFAYTRPAALADALRAAGRDARFVAGSQSLGPMLNLRLAEPPALVDVRRLPELRGARVEGGRLHLGAAVTHAEIEDGAVPDTTHGMLPAVARGIAYRAVRNRGTLGGSLAHADPAADWVNAMTVLGARCHIAGPDGRRVLPVHEFLQGTYRTALGPGELLVEVELPAFSERMRWGYYKVAAKVGEFASAIGAAVHDPALAMTHLLVGAIEARPLLLPPFAGALELAGDAAIEAFGARIAAALPQADAVFVHQHATALARAVARLRAEGAA
ncbi:MAG: FAD binding domain-containing protein [Burkholderiales bacterium]|nr:FAD binding domain-containing protein [Burkholderiales bacterium]